MYAPIILGTAREGRRSEKVASYMLARAKAAGLESEVLDVRGFRVGSTDNTQASKAAKAFSEEVSKADALIIVSPEYNHGYPGELKMMLDLLYQQYFNKPVGICGVSKGPLGGARMVEKLRLVFIELHMVNIREALYFPFVQDLFDERGEIKDKSFDARAKTFLDELVWYAKALSPVREASKKGV
jgi:NAD(P)H-dependent FMN reductase